MPVAYGMADHAPSADGRVGAGHIRVPPDRGGCGSEHEVQTDDRGYAYLDCDRCAPALVGSHYGWAASPGGVPLTPDEIADRELAERDAKSSQNTLLRAMTDSFVKALQGGGPLAVPGAAAAQPKSLMEQIAELGPADKAALAAMLAPQAVGDAEDVPADTAAPATAPPPARVPVSDGTVKRGPGRPRKTG